MTAQAHAITAPFLDPWIVGVQYRPMVLVLHRKYAKWRNFGDLNIKTEVPLVAYPN